MNREEWIKSEIAEIKAGGDMRCVCVMATPDRLLSGLCSGAIPAERMRRGSDTCSPECQADKKRLRRWQASKGHCRLCGRNMPRTRKEDVLHRAQEELQEVRDGGSLPVVLA